MELKDCYATTEPATYCGSRSQCSRKAKVEHEGRGYCKQHDPLSVQKKEAERTRENKRRWAAEDRLERLHGAAPALLEAAKYAAKDLEHFLTTPDAKGYVVGLDSVYWTRLRLLKSRIRTAEETE